MLGGVEYAAQLAVLLVVGIDLEQPSDEVDPANERLFECPVYAEIQEAAVVGRVATGPRAGAPVVRVGREGYAAEITASSPARAPPRLRSPYRVAVPAGDRDRLEHLCRYVLRAPIAQERLELTADGKVLLRLRRTWRDGTRAIRFEPTDRGAPGAAVHSALLANRAPVSPPLGLARPPRAA